MFEIIRKSASAFLNSKTFNFYQQQAYNALLSAGLLTYRIWSSLATLLFLSLITLFFSTLYALCHFNVFAITSTIQSWQTSFVFTQWAAFAALAPAPSYYITGMLLGTVLAFVPRLLSGFVPHSWLVQTSALKAHMEACPTQETSVHLHAQLSTLEPRAWRDLFQLTLSFLGVLVLALFKTPLSLATGLSPLALTGMLLSLSWHLLNHCRQSNTLNMWFKRQNIGQWSQTYVCHEQTVYYDGNQIYIDGYPISGPFNSPSPVSQVLFESWLEQCFPQVKKSRRSPSSLRESFCTSGLWAMAAWGLFTFSALDFSMLSSTFPMFVVETAYQLSMLTASLCVANSIYCFVRTLVYFRAARTHNKVLHSLSSSHECVIDTVFGKVQKSDVADAYVTIEANQFSSTVIDGSVDETITETLWSHLFDYTWRTHSLNVKMHVHSPGGLLGSVMPTLSRFIYLFYLKIRMIAPTHTLLDISKLSLFSTILVTFFPWISDLTYPSLPKAQFTTPAISSPIAMAAIIQDLLPLHSNLLSIKLFFGLSVIACCIPGLSFWTPSLLLPVATLFTVGSVFMIFHQSAHALSWTAGVLSQVVQSIQHVLLFIVSSLLSLLSFLRIPYFTTAHSNSKSQPPTSPSTNHHYLESIDKITNLINSAPEHNLFGMSAEAHYKAVRETQAEMAHHASHLLPAIQRAHKKISSRIDSYLRSLETSVSTLKKTASRSQHPLNISILESPLFLLNDKHIVFETTSGLFLDGEKVSKLALCKKLSIEHNWEIGQDPSLIEILLHYSYHLQQAFKGNQCSDANLLYDALLQIRSRRQFLLKIIAEAWQLIYQGHIETNQSLDTDSITKKHCDPNTEPTNITTLLDKIYAVLKDSALFSCNMLDDLIDCPWLQPNNDIMEELNTNETQHLYKGLNTIIKDTATYLDKLNDKDIQDASELRSKTLEKLRFFQSKIKQVPMFSPYGYVLRSTQSPHMLMEQIKVLLYICPTDQEISAQFDINKRLSPKCHPDKVNRLKALGAPPLLGVPVASFSNSCQQWLNAIVEKNCNSSALRYEVKNILDSAQFLQVPDFNELPCYLRTLLMNQYPADDYGDIRLAIHDLPDKITIPATTPSFSVFWRQSPSKLPSWTPQLEAYLGNLRTLRSKLATPETNHRWQKDLHDDLLKSRQALLDALPSEPVLVPDAQPNPLHSAQLIPNNPKRLHVPETRAAEQTLQERSTFDID